jgi:hypothetical protein
VLRVVSLSRHRQPVARATAWRVRRRRRHVPTLPVWLAAVLLGPVVAGSVSGACWIALGGDFASLRGNFHSRPNRPTPPVPRTAHLCEWTAEERSQAELHLGILRRALRRRQRYRVDLT